MSRTAPASGHGVDLYWLPLGAGGRVVPRCGRAFERLSAARTGRPPQPLFHSALEVWRDGVPHVVETAPAWSSTDPGRGVVVTGPVGLRALGRLRTFRYEVRRWPGGGIPDVDWAVGGPRRLPAGPVEATRLLHLVPLVPALTWGRDELGLGEMWNSNSVTAWLLRASGVEVGDLTPPLGGRAPGWAAGVALVGRPVGERPGGRR